MSGAPPPWLRVLALGYPSANAVVAVRGARVLVDSGFGSDATRLVRALAGAGVPPEALELVVNTHAHSDHVGGNAHLQAVTGVPVAAHARDAEVVNAGGDGACRARWLDQPVARYRVDRPLHPGDVVAIGPAEWRVVAAPGHTPTHLVLHQPEERLLLLGDALHAGDVGWVDLALDGPPALDAALQTVEALDALGARWAVSGHGPPIADPPAAFADAHRRYARMRSEPERAAWHACTRILAFALMIHDVPWDRLQAYVASRPWLRAHAAHVLALAPEDLARDLVAHLHRSGAVGREGGRAVSRTPHVHPAPAWREASGATAWL